MPRTIRQLLRTLRMTHSNAGPVCAFLALLLIINFLLDILRRFDFKHEAADLQRLNSQANTLIDRAFSLLEERQAEDEEPRKRIEQLTILLQGCQIILDKITTGYNKLQYTFSSGFAASHPTDCSDTTQRFWTLPAQEMERFIEATYEDSFCASILDEFPDIRSFSTDTLTNYLLQLSANQECDTDFLRQLVALRIELYRYLYSAASILYTRDLYHTIGQMTVSGEYDSPTPFGDFVSATAPPNELIAISLTQSKRFVWEKQKWPELHRLSLMPHYVYCVFVRDLIHLLKEGERHDF